MESKKYNKLVSITEKQIHRYREQNSGYQWGGERGNKGVGERETQTIVCTIGSSIYYAIQGI